MFFAGHIGISSDTGHRLANSSPARGWHLNSALLLPTLAFLLVSSSAPRGGDGNISGTSKSYFLCRISKLLQRPGRGSFLLINSFFSMGCPTAGSGAYVALSLPGAAQAHISRNQYHPVVHIWSLPLAVELVTKTATDTSCWT